MLDELATKKKMAQQAEEEAYERFLIPPRIPSKKKSHLIARTLLLRIVTRRRRTLRIVKRTLRRGIRGACIGTRYYRRTYRDKILQKSL